MGDWRRGIGGDLGVGGEGFGGHGSGTKGL